MVQALLKSLTEDEYLAAERDGDVRHEFLHGAVYAMAGGSANHNRIAGCWPRIGPWSRSTNASTCGNGD